MLLTSNLIFPVLFDAENHQSRQKNVHVSICCNMLSPSIGCRRKDMQSLRTRLRTVFSEAIKQLSTEMTFTFVVTTNETRRDLA
jgi:hypothetical protein